MQVAPFTNEPFTDFSAPETAAEMRAALKDVSRELGHEYPLTIAGKVFDSRTPFDSINPANPSQVVGRHAAATEEDVKLAIDQATQAFPGWSQRGVEERASLLLRAAGMIRERHLYFCAWLTLEVGKNWAEADADVGECIDFLEFYAREALKLDATAPPIQFPGERNQLRYVPLGAGAVIPPWNFPFAIMAGMTTAAIVAGNTVVLKPSPDAPTIATKFLDLLLEAGLPPAVVTIVQGGPEIGRALVEDPRIHFIAFTGSKKVGLEIHERAAKTPKGQRFIKRTILELGGKDAIIVAADADIEAAVDGVLASAFGFNGQKCSACSRAIVDITVYDEFCARLARKVQAIAYGAPADNFYAGPVINQAAYDRVLEYIKLGQHEGRLLAGGHARTPAEQGFYIEPTVIADVGADSRLAQEEVFGPLLVIIPAQGVDDALRIANGTEYGLTGAIYTSSRQTLTRAARDFHVGNLYLNRKCTGAMVGAHPFGGFGLSGTDSKAGGPDYLLLFTQAKSVAEKLGIVSPEVEEQEQRMGI